MKRMRLIVIVSFFVFGILSPLFLETSKAALCSFRNPERDVYILFPEATGYRSVMKKLDKNLKKDIEKYLGQKLDFDEGGGHRFYLVLKGKEVIGTIRPHAERGKYGIVEMVWAFSLDGKIIDYSIQRSRERGTDKVKSEEFRKQFRGKSLKHLFTEINSKDINSKLFKVPEKSEKVSSVIAYSAKKNLFLYKLFFPDYNKVIDEDPKGEAKEYPKDKSELK